MESKRITLVTKNGTIYIVGDTSLDRWHDLDHSLDNKPLLADSMHESDTLHAMIVDRGGKVFAVDDITKQANFLADTATDENDPLVFDLARSRSALVVGHKNVLQIVHSGEEFTARSLLNTVHDVSPLYYSKIFKEALTYGSVWFFQKPQVKVVGIGGFENVEGGNIEIEPLRTYGRIAKDLPALHAVVIIAANGLHLYDGKRLQRVSRSGHEDIGYILDVFHSTTLQKVIVSTDQGVFELTSQLILRRINVPAPAEGHLYFTINDWPGANSMLLFDDNAGIYVLDGDLNAKKLAGSYRIPARYNAYTLGYENGNALFLENFERAYMAIQVVGGKDDRCAQDAGP